MRRTTRQLGEYGERIARQFLEQKGYAIIDQHVTSRFGEIDILSKDPASGELVFVEVKTRRSTSVRFGHPYEAISETKLQRLRDTIDIYLAQFPEIQPHRLDCIFILFSDTGESEKPTIEHLQACG